MQIFNVKRKVEKPINCQILKSTLIPYSKANENWALYLSEDIHQNRFIYTTDGRAGTIIVTIIELNNQYWVEIKQSKRSWLLVLGFFCAAIVTGLTVSGSVAGLFLLAGIMLVVFYIVALHSLMNQIVAELYYRLDYP